jgi:hypothetical protein
MNLFGNYINIFPFYFFIFFWGCTNDNPNQINNEIYKITFASEDYMRQGPFIAIEIDNTLKLKYYGGLNSKPEGFYYGTITSGKWDSIIMMLNKMNYQNLDSIYPVMVDDRSIEMFIHANSDVKHILAQVSRLPEDVVARFDSIINIYKTINLEKTDDSLRFESHIQEFNPPTEQSIKFIGPDQ